MKKFFLFALVATLFAACSTDATQDVAPEIPTAPNELHVSFDAEDTRIQLGENGTPVWTEGDLVSVFYRSDSNDKYQFQGKTGDTEGSIKLVESGTPTTATTRIVAVYPYNASYWFNWETYNVEAFMPAEQTYLTDSYGVGSSLMVSSSEFNQLSFKNVCGWLKLQFTGNGYVSNIVLRGNNGEQVAGKIYVNTSDASSILAATMGESGDSVGGIIEEEGTILTSVTLNCGEAGVRLNAETPKSFYIALPPQTFAQGITITATCDDGTVLTKATENAITIERNHILPMATLTIEKPQEPDTPAQPTPPANEIWYTSKDGNIVEPYFDDEFGATLLSNTYEEGLGIIKFNGNITEVGYYAFYECNKLTSITIPNSVTSIGNDAFQYCSALTSVTIPNSVTSIGEEAFAYCSKLTSVTIGNGVTSIGERAFSSCTALKRVDITDLEAWCEISFGSSANPFYSSGGGDIYLNGELLENVVIPESITELKGYVFYGVDCIKSVTIPNSVTKIGDEAFRSCDALTSVNIPDSVTEIGNAAFARCSALTSFYGKFASEDNRCLIIDGVLKAFAPAGLTTYTIPNSVTSIGNAAFVSCKALTSITIPNSVTEIGERAFSSCTALKSITIGNGVTSIGERAFSSCYALTSINIPNSVIEIGSMAFYYCEALTSVTIPNSVTSVGEKAFDYCNALKKVYCKPTTPPTGGSGMFNNNASGRRIFVPTASVDAYKAALYWSSYKSDIEPYDFTE